MRRASVVLLCLSGILNSMAAQESTPAIPKLPPAMQSAIDRIVEGKVAPVALKRLELQGGPSATGTCSVPLVEMRIDHPERFAMQRMAQIPRKDVMPRIQVPAPACEQSNR